MYKDEVDDECLSCPHYHEWKEHISMDAYNDYPAGCECGYDWDCPGYEPETEDVV